MKGAIAIRKAVGKPGVLDTSGTNVTSGAYVTLVTAVNMTAPCSAVQLHNSGAQPLKLAAGAAGSEVDTGIVIPLGVSILIPLELKAGVRLSLESLGGTQATGIVTVTFFQ